MKRVLLINIENYSWGKYCISLASGRKKMRTPNIIPDYIFVSKFIEKN